MKCDDINCFKANDYILFIIETNDSSNNRLIKYKEEKFTINDIKEPNKWNKYSVEVSLDNKGESLKVSKYLLL